MVSHPSILMNLCDFFCIDLGSNFLPYLFITFNLTLCSNFTIFTHCLGSLLSQLSYIMFCHAYNWFDHNFDHNWTQHLLECLRARLKWCWFCIIYMSFNPCSILEKLSLKFTVSKIRNASSVLVKSDLLSLLHGFFGKDFECGSSKKFACLYHDCVVVKFQKNLIPFTMINCCWFVMMSCCPVMFPMWCYVFLNFYKFRCSWS